MYRVLMIAPTPFFADRGCHVRILGEIKALESLGIEVTLCTYHNGRNVAGVRTKRIPNIPWYNKLSAGPSYHKYYLDIILTVVSLWTAIRVKPHIIHAHLHEGALVGLLLRLLTRTPVLLDFQGSLVDEVAAHNFAGRESLHLKLLYRLERAIYRAVDGIIVNTDDAATLLIERFGVDGARIRVAKDGIDTGLFKPMSGEDVSRIKRKFGLPLDKKLVVYLGLLNEYQGTDMLIDAISHFVRDHRDTHFVVAGFPNVEKYRAIAKDNDIEEFVTFVGKIDFFKEAPSLISIGDVAVAPKMSQTEGNGKIYNYMACGVPVVAFDTKVNREILDDLGVYAEFGNAEAISDCIEGLLKDAETRKTLGQRIRRRVVTDLSLSGSGKTIMKFYRESLGRYRQGPRRFRLYVKLPPAIGLLADVLYLL